MYYYGIVANNKEKSIRVVLFDTPELAPELREGEEYLYVGVTDDPRMDERIFRKLKLVVTLAALSTIDVVIRMITEDGEHLINATEENIMRGIVTHSSKYVKNEAVPIDKFVDDIVDSAHSGYDPRGAEIYKIVGETVMWIDIP